MESLWLITGLCSLVAFGGGCWVGKFWSGLSFRKHHKDEKEKMFTIEQALKEFWDHERAKLEKEIKKRDGEIAVLEDRVDHYRKKLSGVGILGMGKDKKSEMLMGFLMENEALEEKLFQQNLKLHQEREEFLKREMDHVSYKKILLSHMLKNPAIQKEIQTYLDENPQIPALPLPLEDREN